MSYILEATQGVRSFLKGFRSGAEMKYSSTHFFNLNLNATWTDKEAS